MLEVTYGRARNQQVAFELSQLLLELGLEGSLYIGYPIMATSENLMTVDALLVTAQHGLVVFLFDENSDLVGTDEELWEMRKIRQDEVFILVENSLRRYPELMTRRKLSVTVRAITLIPSSVSSKPESVDGEYYSLEEISEILDGRNAMDEQYVRPLQAALQKVSTMRPPKRRTGVRSSESKGAILKRIEREIANLDQWQKRAAIECPDGPQRIRGLAGSGKTIVLALKAAYLHAQNPDWTICVTFWSRALYQQFEDLIRRFSYEHLNDEPDWQKLRVLHAWGGYGREGLYQQVAQHCGVIPRNFTYGRSMYGRDHAFEGVCSELWSKLESTSVEPIYDAILIDEAQDLPIPFFKAIRKMTRSPKRVIWAYDELQNLSDSAMPTLEEQFGVDADGQPEVNLINPDNGPRQDVVLPICYRNTPWALTLAHGLGLGTVREEGLVQSFDDPSFWSHIGYDTVDGELREGEMVTLERSSGSYPSYFVDLLNPTVSIESKVFRNYEAQAQWVARRIREDIDQDELEYDDFLIVLPEAYTARSDASVMLRALSGVGLEGHIPGDTASQDEIFKPNSIAIAHIHRSKGNEASMVYVVHAQQCVSSNRAAISRNILFTAITRSKAWVRICGVGPHMRTLQEEIDAIRESNYQLRFRVPTQDQLLAMRQLHRDPSASERARMVETERAAQTFLEALDSGEITVDDLPIHLRTSFARHLGGNSVDS